MADYRHILVAEDETNISDFLRRGLEDSGYTVSTAADGNEAWLRIEDMMSEGQLSLLLLDIRMPGMSGLQLCERFRKHYGYSIPVILLTALATTDDIVAGLHAGADDYLCKPFKFAELLARIAASLRRTPAAGADCLEFRCGPLLCNPSTHKAVREGVTVELTAKEYRLLEYFIRHQGEVLTRQQLLSDVWDKDFDPNTNVVDVYIRYIRSKIDDPFEHKLIHTVVGSGYMMKE
ncbi:MAG: response regulator transcription factor [Bacteroidaceae bacterium]|nr:response regulator transcription factor [Bacteroidaceae bacterium]